MSTPPSTNDLPISLSEDLVPSRAPKPAGTFTTTLSSLLPTPLQLHEDLKEGCGGQLWPAGMVLAEYLLTHEGENLGGKTILELGAGGGLVGLALGLGLAPPAAQIVITDQQPMLPLMQHNIVLNTLSSHVSASVLDWGTPLSPDIPVHPDIVLAADCVYFEPAFPLLLQTLQEVIGEKTVCWFCYKKRRRADVGFMKSARKVFAVERVGEGEAWGREGIFLYKFTKQSTGTK